MNSFFPHANKISTSTNSIFKNMIVIPNSCHISDFLIQHNTSYYLFLVTQHYYSSNFHPILLLESYFYAILILLKIFFMTLEMKLIVGSLFTLISILLAIQLLEISFRFGAGLFIFSLVKWLGLAISVGT